MSAERLRDSIRICLRPSRLFSTPVTPAGTAAGKPRWHRAEHDHRAHYYYSLHLRSQIKLPEPHRAMLCEREKDPGETANLIEDTKAGAARTEMLGRLVRWMRETGDFRKIG
jgi:hypothetical protein